MISCRIDSAEGRIEQFIVLLGALIELTHVVSPEAIERAMEKHVNERFRRPNLEAFEAGRRLGRQTHG